MQFLGDFLVQSEPDSMVASRASVDYSASESSGDSDDKLSQQKWWNGRAVWPVRPEVCFQPGSFTTIFIASGSGWNLVMLGQGEQVAVVFPWGRSLLSAVVV